MPDVIDLEEFGLCSECARPYNVHHAIGCSRAAVKVKQPQETISTCSVVIGCVVLAMLLGLVWACMAVYTDLPPCFATGPGGCT